MTVICAESPIALDVEPWGVTPLTPCCQAMTTFCDADHVCKGCYEYVDWTFGDCWNVDEQRGWDGYRALLMDHGVDSAKADVLVAYARQRAESV